MSFDKQQYDEQINKYYLTRMDNERLHDDRVYEVYDKLPRIRQIDEEITSSSINASIEKLRGIEVDKETIKRRNEALKVEKYKLLEAAGYSLEYLEPIYTCPLCKDTGFVGDEPCKCFKEAITKALYKDSGIDKALDRENFDTFSYEYYSDKLDGTHKYSPLQNIQNIVAKSHSYVDTFGESSDSILIRGETGLGKTFLTNCIAKDLLDKGHTVYYVTSINMFDSVIGDVVMGKNVNDKTKSLYNNLYDAELLIIDDLGTELTNSYVATQLFQVLNTRLLKGKSTIISTNLNLHELRDRYSERVVSRIIASYMVFELYGDNIRYAMRIKGRNQSV